MAITFWAGITNRFLPSLRSTAKLTISHQKHRNFVICVTLKNTKLKQKQFNTKMGATQNNGNCLRHQYTYFQFTVAEQIIVSFLVVLDSEVLSAKGIPIYFI